MHALHVRPPLIVTTDSSTQLLIGLLPDEAERLRYALMGYLVGIRDTPTLANGPTAMQARLLADRLEVYLDAKEDEVVDDD